MNRSPDEQRSWPQGEPEAERAVEQLRRSLARVRSQVETFKHVVQPEGEGDAEPT